MIRLHQLQNASHLFYTRWMGDVLERGLSPTSTIGFNLPVREHIRDHFHTFLVS
jgi:hypothetical protein